MAAARTVRLHEQVGCTAAVDVARSAVYVGDTGVGNNLLVLAIWDPSVWS